MKTQTKAVVTACEMMTFTSFDNDVIIHSEYVREWTHTRERRKPGMSGGETQLAVNTGTHQMTHDSCVWMTHVMAKSGLKNGEKKR